jgi:hypothetical protein
MSIPCQRSKNKPSKKPTGSKQIWFHAENLKPCVLLKDQLTFSKVYSEKIELSIATAVRMSDLLITYVLQ